MKSALLGLIAIALTHTAVAASLPGGQFQNLDRMIQELNLRPYFTDGQKARKRLKIAVFDNGFRGAAKEIGRSLPKNTKIHRGPVAAQGEEEVHGFYMARILWSLLSLGGTDQRYAPAELHLYNTFGYSNLKAAIDDAIRNKVDIVLYSQTWEYGGNFDGRGFINKLIDRAIDSGILWINNSGNVGSTSFNGGMETGADDWLSLPGRNQSIEVRCEKNPAKECLLRAVLSWNDFSDNVEEGSDKDLDFVLTDDTLNIIQGSSLTQSKDAGDQPGTSRYPREIITAKVKPGLYFFRVKNRSKNFARQDRFRLVVNGDSLSMPGHDAQESLLPPADNARAITVGAADSERTSVSHERQKPELWTNSLVSLSKEENFKGTSNSAAMVAAGAAILLSREPDMGRDEILSGTGTHPGSRGPTMGAGQGLPLAYLGFQPTGPNGCFVPANIRAENLPAHLQQLLSQGGTVVETTAGKKIVFGFDPILLTPRIRRQLANDILVSTAQGPGLFPRSSLFQLPAAYVELFQLPQGTAVCGSGNSRDIPSWAKVFRLP